MDFKDMVRSLGKRVEELSEYTNTEEATKNAFIMPFLNLLGFDVFNPTEVKPEYVADIGLKKGEKIDYAIFKDGRAILLVECKHWKHPLCVDNESQLLRYFHVSNAKFALLTNGFEYRFYTDLDEPNIMDRTPFLAFDITKITDNQIAELKKFSKAEFDSDKIATSASELKYTLALREILKKEFADPSEGLVRHFAQQAYSGRFTQQITEYFTGLVKKTIDQFLSDTIKERFNTAIEAEKVKEEAMQSVEEIPQPVPEDDIVTTEEELEGFRIVKAIVCQKIPASRVVYRDAKSYFAILLDDNSRKPICRLYYNRKKKYVGLFNDPENFQGLGGAKKEVWKELPGETPNEWLYAFSADLLQTIDYYERCHEMTPIMKDFSPST